MPAQPTCRRTAAAASPRLHAHAAAFMQRLGRSPTASQVEIRRLLAALSAKGRDSSGALRLGSFEGAVKAPNS